MRKANESVAAMERASNLAVELADLFSMVFEYEEKMVASSVKTIEPKIAPASPPPLVTLASRNRMKKSFMLANK